jgi:AbrB family looped-hinge helix DNA binding protein
MDKSDHHFRLAGTGTVGPKGQVVIPADVRESMGIKPGDRLVTLYIPHKQAVAFITEAQAQQHIDHMGERLSGLRDALKNQQ